MVTYHNEYTVFEKSLFFEGLYEISKLVICVAIDIFFGFSVGTVVREMSADGGSDDELGFVVVASLFYDFFV